jgi:hypothetical protein
MTTESYDQLAIYSVVARERSFTRAAAKLGMSQPALSRTIRNLEERLSDRGGDAFAGSGFTAIRGDQRRIGVTQRI